MTIKRRWIFALLIGLLGLAIIATTFLLYRANTPSGREFIEKSVSTLTAGNVNVLGLSGRFPDAITIKQIEVRDQTGVWLSIDGVVLSWTPQHLLAGKLAINRLEADHIKIDRLPISSTPKAASDEAPISLPINLVVNKLHVGDVALASAVTGQAVRLAIDASTELSTQMQGNLNFSALEIDGAGVYVLRGQLDDNAVNANLSVQEPASGLLANLIGLQEQQPLLIDGTVTGPLTNVQNQFSLKLGALTTIFQGKLDFVQHQADLTATAQSTALQLKSGIAWQALNLNSALQGAWTQPTLNAQLRMSQARFAETRIGTLALSAQGDAGKLTLDGQLDSLKLAESPSDLLQAKPLKLSASLGLDAPNRPLALTLTHPSLNASGTAITAGDTQSAKLDLSLPNLQAFAVLAGLDLKGQSKLTLAAKQQSDHANLNLAGTLAVTGGDPTLQALLGGQTTIDVNAEQRGADKLTADLKLDGKKLSFKAQGDVSNQIANFSWQSALNDLSALVPETTGKLAAQGSLNGPLDKLKVSADVNGEMAGKKALLKSVKAKLQLENLPNAPTGRLEANGSLLESAFALALDAKSLTTGATRVAIERANWKSLQAQGELLLPKNVKLTTGTIDLRMARLADLQPLLGQPLSGAMNANLSLAPQQGQPSGRLQLKAQQLGLAETATCAQTNLELTATDLLQKPRFNGKLALDGLSAANLNGFAQLNIAGTLDALTLQLASEMQDPKDTKIKLNTATVLNAPKNQLNVTELTVDWQAEQLRLLDPAQVNFGNGISIDSLRLGLRKAVLALSGRVSPDLDIAASITNLPADLAKLIAPDLAATGSLNLDAKLHGNYTHPVGTINVAAADLKLHNNNLQALPGANLNASAQLDGSIADINAALKAGSQVTLNIKGQAPLNPDNTFDLRADGLVDLKLFEPLLGASGQRTRGQLKLDGTLTGTLSEPLTKATITLDKVEFRDYALGTNITQINGLLKTEHNTFYIDKLEGRAGAGTLSAHGSLDLLKEGMPIDLTLTARNARPMATDRLTVNLDADLKVRGQMTGKLMVAGPIVIKQAEIRIPERMPASIAVLKIQAPGATPPKPPRKSQSNIALDIKIDAPNRIFVRGRGLDAELDGTIKVGGTTTQLAPNGVFKLRRGQFNLAGKSLTFSEGSVNFDGGSLTDPALNFIASTTSNNTTATLAISGTANKPKISLSSVPELPQDEILAQLLFKQSTSQLSVLEMVQIGGALASLTGVSSGFDDPLEGVRKGLGLDRLSVGGGASTSVEAGRYVMPGVYVGAKQGISVNSTQATIQIDITRNLKLEAAVGTGGATTGKASTANSIGVIYQFEY